MLMEGTQTCTRCMSCHMDTLHSTAFHLRPAVHGRVTCSGGPAPLVQGELDGDLRHVTEQRGPEATVQAQHAGVGGDGARLVTRCAAGQNGQCQLVPLLSRLQAAGRETLTGHIMI